MIDSKTRQSQVLIIISMKKIWRMKTMIKVKMSPAAVLKKLTVVKMS